MMVAGIGCRRGASADEIMALITQALDRLGPVQTSLGVIATLSEKAEEPGICEASRRLSLPLVACTHEAIRAAVDRIVTFSARAQAATGLPSVAEGAALAAAGPASRLLLARISSAGVTCAIAERQTA